MIEKIQEYVDYFLDETKTQHAETNEVILKSALVYQYLYHKHFSEPLTIDQVLEINDGEIGLIGAGNGWTTQILEPLFGWSRKLHTHSILHDAFGRFYCDFGKDRGYLYMIPARYTPTCLKKFPLCGQIFGLIFCITKGIII